MKNSILFLALLSVTLISYSQEKRLALVIGNSAYEHGGELRNPVNDANAMSNALTQLGFDVLTHVNLNQSRMKRAIDEFGQKLNSYDVGLFFYAGHGIQSKGNNYLIPVDAKLIDERQIEYDCVQANRALTFMEASGSEVNMVILDACRNNPFERSWERSTSGMGLAFMDAPSGTLIAYATAPGSTASDGDRKNGLYTEAILESLTIPNITVLKMFQNVRGIVTERSNNQQTPWESTSLIGDFYFVTESIVDETPLTLSEAAANIPSSDSWFGREMKGAFIDTRDGQVYSWIRIGEQIWMAENLNYPTGYGSWCYDDNDGNCNLYGLLYNWETSNVVCPDSWHLPSDEEWKTLEKYLGMSTEDSEKKGFRGTDEGGKLKQSGVGHWMAPNTGSTNESGFSSLSGGYRVSLPDGDRVSTGVYSSIGVYTGFWTSSETSNFKAWHRTLHYNKSEVHRNNTDKGGGFSVRCIKNQ